MEGGKGIRRRFLFPTKIDTILVVCTDSLLNMNFLLGVGEAMLSKEKADRERGNFNFMCVRY